jgi:hypothetical protein
MASELPAFNVDMTSRAVNPPPSPSQIPSRPIQSPDIKSFNKNTDDLPGYRVNSITNVKQKISKKEKGLGGSQL